ncbi:MAG: hypothetical protein QG570_277 [Patescibacteria group bacterium]|nr:hypothetical protein [Patescibacteria group bacterium]
MAKYSNYATGLWKFADSISEAELLDLANEWAKDDRFINLYIRKCSKDQNGIGYTYKYAEEDFDTKEIFISEFTEKFKDQLYKKFGTGFVGWDISSSTTFVKGFNIQD